MHAPPVSTSWSRRAGTARAACSSWATRYRRRRRRPLASRSSRGRSRGRRPTRFWLRRGGGWLTWKSRHGIGPPRSARASSSACAWRSPTRTAGGERHRRSARHRSRAGGEAVVVGAHYDHLGRVGGSRVSGRRRQRLRHRRRPRAGPRVRGGGRAAAHAGRSRCSAPRSSGWSARATTCARPPLPLARTVAMVNFDMVGRLRDGRLTVGGVATAGGLSRARARGGARGVPVDIAVRRPPYGPSDHSRFYAAGVPVLFFHTGGHERLPPADRHRRQDRRGRHGARRRRRAPGSSSGWRPDARPVYAQRRAPDPPPEHRRRRQASAFLGVSADRRAASPTALTAGERRARDRPPRGPACARATCSCASAASPSTASRSCARCSAPASPATRSRHALPARRRATT